MPILRNSPLHRLLAALAASTALLGTAQSVWAQLGLPDQIVEESPLTDDHKTETNKFIESNKGGLTGKPDAIRRARGALGAPLQNPKASVDFRQLYSDQLVPVLRPLIADPSDVVAINALTLAGQIGTKQALDLAEQGLADKRPSVRVAAAFAYRSAFNAARRGLPALSANQATSLLTTLQRKLAVEADPMVQDAMIQAIAAVTEIPAVVLPGVSSAAVKALAESSGDLARRGGNGTTPYGALSKAGKTLFDLLSNPSAAIPNEALVSIGGYSGDVIALAKRRLAAGPLDADERSSLALIVGQATQSYFLSHQRLGAGTPVALRLDDLITKKQDAQFTPEADKLIGKDGALTKAPFNLPPDRFAK